MIGEILIEAIGTAVTDGWETVTRATHQRFGWFAALIIGLSPFIIFGLMIWLIVAWVT